MKNRNNFAFDMLCLENREDEILRVAAEAVRIAPCGGCIEIDIAFAPYRYAGRDFVKLPEAAEVCTFFLRSYAGGILRLGNARESTSPMLEFAPDLKEEELIVNGLRIETAAGELRASFEAPATPFEPWENCRELPVKADFFPLTLYPDGKTPVAFHGSDIFCEGAFNSVPLAYTSRETLWSLHAAPNETFTGTGERFSKIDLAGKTVTLENVDALGSNSRRAYKNTPFYLSSAGYGLFIHTSYHTVLSFADISTCAAQGMVDSRTLDLFFCGGETPERILYNYRRLTGFPPELPLWSYGVWMSRMTYFSAEEVDGICEKMRAEQFPCDVIHVDTGWFERDWVCDFKFSPTRFPEPEKWLAKLRSRGFRVTLWQMPDLSSNNPLLPEAEKNGYVALRKKESKNASDFSDANIKACIDFSNPEAVKWYQSLLAGLLKKGVSAIKTDFGEAIDPEAVYNCMSAEELHNLYALIYQRAAFEVTREITGEGIIWARSGWAGSQRYPLHWGGDASSTYDGMLGSLRGGLHFGCSGFAFWSHDVPGFYGFPYFLGSKPEEMVYLRWTQFGVFTSHLRYHGCWRREPYEYPGIADTVREFFKLRYALIPYLVCEARKSVRSGMPLLRPMFLAYPADPACRHLDDQYMLGDSLLVAPVYTADNVRDLYLPAGEWVDFWTGDFVPGGRYLRNVVSDAKHIPVFCRKGDSLTLYPEPVQCTDEMEPGKYVSVKLDGIGIAAALPGLKLNL